MRLGGLRRLPARFPRLNFERSSPNKCLASRDARVHGVRRSATGLACRRRCTRVAWYGDWTWAAQAGGTGRDEAIAIVDVRPYGVYGGTGAFAVDATCGAVTVASRGMDDVFVLRLPRSGW
jgi:hypothetical protein